MQAGRKAGRRGGRGQVSQTERERLQEKLLQPDQVLELLARLPLAQLATSSLATPTFAAVAAALLLHKNLLPPCQSLELLADSQAN